MNEIEGLRYKRTLFIGLGGAGAQTLHYLKKKVKDANDGKIPKQVKFLLIDTNTTDLANYQLFDCSEKVCISVREPYARYEHDRDINGKSITHKYIPPQNAHSLLALDRGAGQVRSNGHFAVIENQYSNRLVSVFRKLADEVESVDIDGDNLEKDPKIEIRLVFSIAGGTGSGIFLPISVLLRSAIKNCELTAYIYSATHYESTVEKSAKYVVMQNAYASLVELDYMMHFGRKMYDPVSFRFGPDDNQEIQQTNRPFDDVYYIDKPTNLETPDTIEYTYNDRVRVQENTADAMHLASTNMISAHAGTIDNVRQKIKEGLFDVGDKFAWVSGFGMAEIFLDKQGENSQKVIDATNQALFKRIEKYEDPLDDIHIKLINKFAQQSWNETNENGDEDRVIKRFFKETQNEIYNYCYEELTKDKCKKLNVGVDYKGQGIGIEDFTKKKPDLVVKEAVGEFKDQLERFIKNLIDDDIYAEIQLEKEGKKYQMSLDLLGKILTKIKESYFLRSSSQLGLEAAEFERMVEPYKQENNNINNDTNNNINNKTNKPGPLLRLLNKITGNNGQNNNNQNNNNQNNNGNSNIDIKYPIAHDISKALSYEICGQRCRCAKNIFDECIVCIDKKIADIQKYIEKLTILYEYGTEQQGNKIKNSIALKTSNKVEVEVDTNSYKLKWDEIEGLNLQLQEKDKDLVYPELRKKVCDETSSLYDYLLNGLNELENPSKDLKTKRGLYDKRTECQKKIDKLLDLSIPTMQVEEHGFGRHRVNVDTFWYIFTDTKCKGNDRDKNKDNNNSEKKSLAELLQDLIKQQTEGSVPQIIHVDGWKNKAILYRVVAAVPPYFVNGVSCRKGGGITLEGCYEELKKTKRAYTPFSHEVMRSKLENRISVLKPYDSSVDDFAMEHWVNFMILSRLQEYEGCYLNFKQKKQTLGKYSVLSEELGKCLTTDLVDDKKVFILGETRKDAFDIFSRYCKQFVEENTLYKELANDVSNPDYEAMFILDKEKYFDIVLPGWKNFRYDDENSDPEYEQLKREAEYIDKRRADYCCKKKKRECLKFIVATHRKTDVLDDCIDSNKVDNDKGLNADN